VWVRTNDRPGFPADCWGADWLVNRLHDTMVAAPVLADKPPCFFS